MESNKRILLVLFLLMVALQIYVPASMVTMNEDVVTHGTKILLEVAPLDPNDPFRGKYIMLNFGIVELEENAKEEDWVYGEQAFLTFSTDSFGFQVPGNLFKSPPEGLDYMKVTVDYAYEGRVRIDYPFDRFYMDENKALSAENLYFESLADTTKKTYAVVYIKDGKAVLQDIQINGESIADLVGENN